MKSGQPEAEEQLKKLWSRVLNIDSAHVTAQSNFLHTCSSSLKIVSLVSQINKTFGTKVSIKDIIKNPDFTMMLGLVGTLQNEIPDSVEVVSRELSHELSSHQLRILLDTREPLANSAYNCFAAYRVKTSFDQEKVRHAVNRLIKNHLSLRTVFLETDGDCRQIVLPQLDGSQCTNFIELNAADNQSNLLNAIFLKELNTSFNIQQAPLWRITFIHESPACTLICLTMHHLISDGISYNIFLKGFFSSYKDGSIEPPRTQYIDFVHWQKKWLKSDAYYQSRTYWLNRYETIPNPPDLPYDKSAGGLDKFQGNTRIFRINSEDYSKIKNSAIQTGNTVFNCLLSIYLLMLHKITGTYDVVTGIPMSGREQAWSKNTIGMFVNTVAFRSNIDPLDSYLTFLLETRDNIFEDHRHQEFPYGDLIKALDHHTGHSNSLITNFFSYHDLNDTLENIGQEVQPVLDYPKQRTIAGLVFEVFDYAQNITIRIDYGVGCSAAFIDRMVTVYQKILEATCLNPNITIAAILAEDKSCSSVLHGKRRAVNWNIIDLFKKQVALRPGSTALCFDGIELSYKALDKKASIFARMLLKVNPDRRLVVIMLHPGIDMVVSMIAAMKAGAAFIPIDPNYPSERINQIVDNSQAQLLIVNKHVPDAIKRVEVFQVNNLTALEGENDGDAAPVIQTQINPTDSAYVIYTSGTTGVPKGVKISHRALANLCLWHNDYYQITATDNASQYASPGFDACIWEIFPYLAAGASVHILPPAVKADLTLLSAYFSQNQISVAFLPTQVAEEFMRLDNSSLRLLLVGGDKMKSFRGELPYRVFNNYGPTENTVVTTAYEVKSSSANIPIGTPVDNCSVYILNPSSQEVLLQGVAGELCITGASLLKGYMNLPEATALKFVKNPFGEGMMYRTGDLARVNNDGNIEYLGRTDNQVKLRGYRIELNEIESKLNQHPDIRDVILTVREVHGEARLCAYYVADSVVSEAAFNRFLSKWLPDYMIPSHYLRISTIPLTPHGKRDVGSLPPPPSAPRITMVNRAPSQVEEAMIEIWSNVLNVSLAQINIQSNFFHLGGHSLQAIQVRHAIKKVLNTDVTQSTIYTFPTLEKLCEHIGSSPAISESAEQSENVDEYTI